LKRVTRILDGEVIALRADGAPHPFPVTMQRFGRRLEIEKMRADIPLTPFFFDLLYADGESLVDASQESRVARLGLVAPSTVVPIVVRPSPESARQFLAETLRRGHEGVMVKALAAGYAAGRRGQQWLKVKLARTLDLVILAAEWGHGRRTGFLSNLHLGARDPEHGGFVMLGKTFKGLTDEMLAWQTDKLRALEISHDRHTVFVRPEIVRRDRLQRGAGQLAVSRGAGAPFRAGEELQEGQVCGRRGHDRRCARDLSPIDWREPEMNHEGHEDCEGSRIVSL
jgi:DNA ligase-1